MDLGLKGKAVLVTGGSRGIGRQIGLAFAAEGSDVAICARDPERLARTESEIAAHGGRVRAISADLRTAEGCQRAVDDSPRGDAGGGRGRAREFLPHRARIAGGSRAAASRQ